ncbi:DNA replication/repair protein RecF [Thermoclostridium stercorarium]|uniref:DNA replication/repair protein RecF n=1 Tax=Thermoclostridium stercorarium TaxID=1510 RepID=UPI000AE17165|nr:DNA replication and repair protein RecF [Thermoclostridium stercorarium]
MLCQISKKYLFNLQKYSKIVKNKNVLLKKKQYNSQIDVWNESLAKTGADIIRERRRLVSSLEKRMKRIMLGISEGTEDVSLRYRTSIGEDGEEYRSLMDILAKNKEKEIEHGICLYGPHRDEIEILLNSKNSRYYCSQGQQRSLALALNIAVMEEIEEKTRKTPVLLLDDVMSELDENRRNYLYDLIKDKQAVITSTDKTQFRISDDKVSYVKIRNGTVVRI